MIRIDILTANGYETLVLDPDTSLRVEVNSTIFESDTIPGDKIFSFDIPAVPANIQKIGSLHTIPLNSKTKIFSCNYYLQNILFFSGHLIIDNANSESYSAQISINPFVVEFKDKLLSELDFGDDIFLGDDTDEIIASCKTFITQSYPDTVVQFPYLRNIAAYGDANADFGGLNHYTGSAYSKNNTSSGNVYTLSAQPYLVHVIKKLFEEQEYDVVGDFFSDNDFRKLLLYSNYMLDETISGLYFANVQNTVIQSKLFAKGGGQPLDRNYDFLLDFDTEITDVNNCFDLANSTYEIKCAGAHEIAIKFDAKIDIVYIVSNFRIRLLLNGNNILDYGWFRASFGNYTSYSESFTYNASVNDIGKKLSLQMYISVNSSAPGDQLHYYIQNAFLNISPAAYEQFNVFKGTFNLANCMPDVSTQIFLNAIKDFFKLAVFFNFSKKEVEFYPVNEIITSSNYFEIDNYINNNDELSLAEENGFVFNFNFESDSLTTDNFKSINDFYLVGEYDKITDVPTPTQLLEIVFIKNLNQYFKSNDAKTKFVYYSDNFPDFEIEPANNDFKPNISPLFMYQNPITLTSVRPAIDQLASSEAFGIGRNSMGLRLMIWNGLQNSSPYASNNNYDQIGNNIGNLSLRWDDEDYGIYEKYHKNWARFFKNSETVRIIGFFPVKDYFKLLSLFEPNVEKLHKIKYKGVNFIPQKISALHDMKSELIEVEIIMCKQGNINS